MNALDFSPVLIEQLAQVAMHALETREPSTPRERIATAVLASIVGRDDVALRAGGRPESERAEHAEVAVLYADALLAELGKPVKP